MKKALIGLAIALGIAFCLPWPGSSAGGGLRFLWLGGIPFLFFAFRLSLRNDKASVVLGRASVAFLVGGFAVTGAYLSDKHDFVVGMLFGLGEMVFGLVLFVLAMARDKIERQSSVASATGGTTISV